MAKIRVLVVDDSSFMRTMLSRMIAKDERFEIVGTAENGKIGVERAIELKPDVITMDVEMPVMTGLDALQEIMRVCPTPVVMISTLTESGARITMEALDKGAVDFLPKALQDGDRNIFNAGEAIHGKLAAAASSKVRGTSSSAPALARIEDLPPAPARAPGHRAGSFGVMIIGSSTGGPKALQAVLQALPARLGIPVVVAQHMPAQFTLALAQRLNEVSSLKVVEMTNGQPLQPDVVYIAPGGEHTRIAGSSTQPTGSVAPDQKESVYRPSVGVLAESARQIFHSHVLAVMLTGMGDDGAREFTTIKQEGGHVIVQDEATSTVYGMPRAVVEHGGATEALPLHMISARIQQILS